MQEQRSHVQEERRYLLGLTGVSIGSSPFQSSDPTFPCFLWRHSSVFAVLLLSVSHSVARVCLPGFLSILLPPLHTSLLFSLRAFHQTILYYLSLQSRGVRKRAKNCVRPSPILPCVVCACLCYTVCVCVCAKERERESLREGGEGEGEEGGSLLSSAVCCISEAVRAL